MSYPQVAPLPITGQASCWDSTGAAVTCGGSGQDGDFQAGVAWPEPRFSGNSNGTVTDSLTGLVWLQDSSCSGLAGSDAEGRADWATALAASAGLADGICDLSDGSQAGDWRLPNVLEMRSLLAWQHSSPSLSDSAGTGQWVEGDPFSGVQSGTSYWTSTSVAGSPDLAWRVFVGGGDIFDASKSGTVFVWPVRGVPPGEPVTTLGASVLCALPGPLPKTGQTSCWDEIGLEVACSGLRHDGDLQIGVSWSKPRFTDIGDGTIRDNLTDLVWLKDGSCPTLAGTDSEGQGTWEAALLASASLESGVCGLSDGSIAGAWRLPNVLELQSLIAWEHAVPAISNTTGTSQWEEGDPFEGVILDNGYWTSTTVAGETQKAWRVFMAEGDVYQALKSGPIFIWPVRGNCTQGVDCPATLLFRDGFECGSVGAWSISAP